MAPPRNQQKIAQDTGKAKTLCSFVQVFECLGQDESVPKMPGHIYFAPAVGHKIPADKEKLKSDIEFTSTVLRDLFQTKANDRFKEYFSELLALAQLGLVCDDADPKSARDALEILQERVLLREARSIKSKHLNGLLITILIAAAIFILAGLLVQTYRPQKLDEFPIQNYAYMLAGAMPGVWLSFACRKQRLTFIELYHPEADMIGSMHRVIYVSLFAAALAILSYFKVVVFSIAFFSTADVGNSVLPSVFYGFLCGFSEQTLATKVAPLLVRLFGSIAKPKGGSAV